MELIIFSFVTQPGPSAPAMQATTRHRVADAGVVRTWDDLIQAINFVLSPMVYCPP